MNILDKKRYVVDIDNTLIFSEIIEPGNYTVKSYNNDLIEITNRLYKKGHQIILYTARHWNGLAQVLEQLKEGNILYTTLVMSKPVGDYYIDDKAIKPEDFIKLQEKI